MPSKPQNNLARMIQLADEFFGTRRDPTQISVDQKIMTRLKKIHPGTMGEKHTSKGPIAWVLVIPTTNALMKQFIKKRITEQELLVQTPFGIKYETVYLCSALVLPEHRGKGLARRLLVKSLTSIQGEHPIESLFCWPFSTQGKKLAASVAKELHLPLYQRTGKH
jgi:hypothetical protein